MCDTAPHPECSVCRGLDPSVMDKLVHNNGILIIITHAILCGVNLNLQCWPRKSN